jgi:uncharacterized SAM-binding protein YcdF (DUF218 family)
MPTPPQKSSPWLRLLAWLLALCALVLALCLFRVPILTALANAWVVSDPLAKADAIVVLGGGLESRPFAAAKFYHDGLAPKVLFMDVRLSQTAKLGVTPSERELTRRVLLSNNVPGAAMEPIGHAVATTYDETQAVRAWVTTHQAKSILIATDLFHTRRVQWIFGKELKGTGVEIRVRAVKPEAYGITDWWRNEGGLIAFQNEVIKYAYYRLKY